MKDDFDVVDVVEEPNIPPQVEDELNEAARHFIQVKARIDKLTKQRNELRTQILAQVAEFGTTVDGHEIFVMDASVQGNKTIVRQRRAVKKLDEAAAEKLLRGKHLYESCTKQVTVLDEDAIMAALYEGDLTDADVDLIFPTKESFALVVRK